MPTLLRVPFHTASLGKGEAEAKAAFSPTNLWPPNYEFREVANWMSLAADAT